MEIPFDNNTGEKYTLEINVSEIEEGDGVVLKLNKKRANLFLCYLRRSPNQGMKRMSILVMTKQNRKAQVLGSWLVKTHNKSIECAREFPRFG